PSVRHPKGEMHSAKTFCVPQKLSSPPFSCRPAVAPLPFAAQESSRKMGEEQNPVSVAREWVAQATSLKAGVTVTLSDVSRYGDVQVEIRTNGTLNWHAWSFEPDFLLELKRNLQYVQL
ncbi:hypothetical protein, partial [Enterobacter sp. 01-M-03-SI-ECC_S142]|uniref:hypothetical protein n=2 Tax=Enterobacteriaceae TaxID=543 RepID=UPI00386270E9